MADDFDSPELDVLIKTEADTAGAQQAARALDDVAGSGGGAAQTLRELTGTSRHTGEVIRGLEGAMRGGASSIGAMVRGLRGLIIVSGTAMGATGLGGIIALLAGAGLGAVMAFTRAMHQTGEAIKGSSEKAEDFKKTMEDVAKSVESDFAGMLTAAKELQATYADLDKMQKESEARTKTLETAKRAVAASRLDVKEQIDLGAATTPEQQERVRSFYAARRELDKLNQEAEDAHNATLSAQAEQNRRETESGRLSQVELANRAEVDKRKAEADLATDKAKDLTRQAQEQAGLAGRAEAATAGAVLGFGGTATKGEREQMEKRAQDLSAAAHAATLDAMKKQEAAKAAETEHAKTMKEVSEGKQALDKANTDLAQAKELEDLKKEEVKNKALALAEKDHNEAVKAATEETNKMAKAADAAAKALERIADKEAKEEAKAEKGEKPTKAEEKAEAAATEHLTPEGLAALHKTTDHVKGATKAAKDTAEAAKGLADAMDKQATALSDAHSRVAHGTKRAAQAAEKAGNQLEVAMTSFHGN